MLIIHIIQNSNYTAKQTEGYFFSLEISLRSNKLTAGSRRDTRSKETPVGCRARKAAATRARARAHTARAHSISDDVRRRNARQNGEQKKAREI